jgi:hypothetical protein
VVVVKKKLLFPLKWSLFLWNENELWWWWRRCCTLPESFPPFPLKGRFTRAVVSCRAAEMRPTTKIGWLLFFVVPHKTTVRVGGPCNPCWKTCVSQKSCQMPRRTWTWNSRKEEDWIRLFSPSL